MEIWKDINGYEGRYKISSNGRVLALSKRVNSFKSKSGDRYVKEKILKQSSDKDGYYRVHLTNIKGITKTINIHKLVALHFVENPNNYPVINHIDEDKSNNKFDNLEWCTIKYNNLYNNRQDKINSKLLNHASLSKIVEQLSIDNILIKEHVSANQAARDLGINRSGISMCCNNVTNTYKGFKWKYKI